MEMDSSNKIITTLLKVGQEPVVAASPEVRGSQRRVGKRHTLEVYNRAKFEVYFGGENVDVDTGIPILPNEHRIFSVGDPYALYLVCGRDEGANVVIAEYCS